MLQARGADDGMTDRSERPTDADIERIVTTYGDMIFKICLVSLGSEADAEDALQNTILKYIDRAPAFHDAEHEKAWLIRVAANICKDMHRFRLRNAHLNIEDLQEYCRTGESTDILEAVMALPQKYKSVLYLFYVEGYKTGAIANILRIAPTTVRKRLQYGRRLLKLEYERE